MNARMPGRARKGTEGSGGGRGKEREITAGLEGAGTAVFDRGADYLGMPSGGGGTRPLEPHPGKAQVWPRSIRKKEGAERERKES